MPLVKDETGKRYGRLLVVARGAMRPKEGGSFRLYWSCRCDCGGASMVLGYHLRSGATRSCGCAMGNDRPRAKNELGNRYGRLTVIERKESTRGRARWSCRCDCGAVKVALGYHLRSGATVSCGCFGQRRKPPKERKPRREPISTKALEISGGHGEGQFIQPHVYRTIRKIEMGPIVAAALAALEERS